MKIKTLEQLRKLDIKSMSAFNRSTSNIDPDYPETAIKKLAFCAVGSWSGLRLLNVRISKGKIHARFAYPTSQDKIISHSGDFRCFVDLTRMDGINHVKSCDLDIDITINYN